MLVSPENKDSSSGQFQECFSGADLLLNINGQIRKRQQISAALTPTNGARKILGDSISSIMSSLCDSFTFDINLTTNHLLAHPQASWEYSLRFPAFYTPEQSDILRFLKSPQASPILQWLLHECSPTSDALSEVLFKKALLSRDLTVADMLIQHKKLDLNTLLPGPWRFSHANHFSGPQYPAEVASNLNDSRMVNFLTQRGAIRGLPQPSTRENCGRTVMAKEKSKTTALSRLLEPIESELSEAIKLEDVERLTELLNQGSDANATDDGTELPVLFLALTSSSAVQIAKTLLDHSANPNISFSGIRPLHVAAANGDLELARLLCKYGARIDSMDISNEGNSDTENTFRPPTPLQIAVFREDFDMAEFLLEEGAEVNAAGASPHPEDAILKVLEELLDLDFSDFHGCTALATCLLERCSYRFVDLLLSWGAKILDVLSFQGIPKHQGRVDDALIYAIENGSQNVASLLLDSGAHFTLEPFVAAIRRREYAIAQRCIEGGLDINTINEDRRSALTLLLLDVSPYVAETLHACKLLIDYGADVNHPDARPTALNMALQQLNPSVAEFLIQNRAYCNRPRTFYLAMGILSNAHTVQMLFENASIDPDFDRSFRQGCFGHPTLYHAVWLEDCGAVSDLLRRDINIHSPCVVEAVRLACIYKYTKHWPNIDGLRQLLRAGAPVNPPEDTACCRCWPPEIGTDKFSPLQTAIERDFYEGAMALLEYGADSNFVVDRHLPQGVRLRYGHIKASILSIAADKGNLDAVNLLLAHGADVNIPASGDFGRTALQAALERQALKIPLVERLLDAGADVNAPPAESRGLTALQAAAIGGFIAPAVKLIELGADVNAPGAAQEGRTALEGAAEHGRLDMVRLLLDAGADLEAPQFGNAVDFARKNGYNAVANMLERYRAGER